MLERSSWTEPPTGSSSAISTAVRSSSVTALSRRTPVRRVSTFWSSRAAPLDHQLHCRVALVTHRMFELASVRFGSASGGRTAGPARCLLS
jgi:hypothetical protein